MYEEPNPKPKTNLDVKTQAKEFGADTNIIDPIIINTEFTT